MKQLQRLREAKGWSRSELARRARISGVTVGWVESGRFRPYPIQLKKLAKALGLPVSRTDELLNDDDVVG